MTMETGTDGGLVAITGRDDIAGAAEIARIHFWRLQATLKVRHGMTPRKGWTIARFNADYVEPGSQCRTWDDVMGAADAIIKAMREDNFGKGAA